MNKFAQYLKKSGHTPSSFATASGISQPMVWQLANKKRLPSLAMMLKIQRATGGKMKCQDWAK